MIPSELCLNSVWIPPEFRWFAASVTCKWWDAFVSHLLANWTKRKKCETIWVNAHLCHHHAQLFINEEFNSNGEEDGEGKHTRNWPFSHTLYMVVSFSRTHTIAAFVYIHYSIDMPLLHTFRFDFANFPIIISLKIFPICYALNCICSCLEKKIKLINTLKCSRLIFLSTTKIRPHTKNSRNWIPSFSNRFTELMHWMPFKYGEILFYSNIQQQIFNRISPDDTNSKNFNIFFWLARPPLNQCSTLHYNYLQLIDVIQLVSHNLHTIRLILFKNFIQMPKLKINSINFLW